jgi:hypothetical protein
VNHRIWVELREKWHYNGWQGVYKKRILVWYLLTVWWLIQHVCYDVKR